MGFVDRTGCDITFSNTDKAQNRQHQIKPCAGTIKPRSVKGTINQVYLSLTSRRYESSLSSSIY